MKIHTSHHEEDLGWINVNKQLPKPDTKVKLCSVHIVDWNMESLEWETSGWIKESGMWSMKMFEGWKWGMKPTHWKPYKYD